MRADSVAKSIQMLKGVLDGKTYVAIARESRPSRSAVEQRVKALACDRTSRRCSARSEEQVIHDHGGSKHPLERSAGHDLHAGRDYRWLGFYIQNGKLVGMHNYIDYLISEKAQQAHAVSLWAKKMGKS